MKEVGARDWAEQGQGLGASKQEGPACSRSGHRRPARARGPERARQAGWASASERAGGMQEGASGGGGPGREAMAMAGVCGGACASAGTW
jgi:hypothetical protein